MSALERGLARRRLAIDSSQGQFRTYSSMKNFDEEFDGRSQLATVELPLPVDIKFNANADSDLLAVYFNSQQTSTTFRLFTWQKVSEELPANRLYFADPVLSTSDEVQLGWYSFAAGVNYQTVVANVIRSVMTQTGARKLVLFGSSGGGFSCQRVRGTV